MICLLSDHALWIEFLKQMLCLASCMCTCCRIWKSDDGDDHRVATYGVGILNYSCQCWRGTRQGDNRSLCTGGVETTVSSCNKYQQTRIWAQWVGSVLLDSTRRIWDFNGYLPFGFEMKWNWVGLLQMLAITGCSAFYVHQIKMQITIYVIADGNNIVIWAACDFKLAAQTRWFVTAS